MAKNIRNTSIFSIYLKGMGLTSDGNRLPEKETALDEKEVRKQCAEIITAKLAEAFASIEILKDLKVFSEDYAEKIMNVAKDPKNTNKYRKAYFKKDIYSKLNKALDKAGKELIKYEDEAKEEIPDFD